MSIRSRTVEPAVMSRDDCSPVMDAKGNVICKHACPECGCRMFGMERRADTDTRASHGPHTKFSSELICSDPACAARVSVVTQKRGLFDAVGVSLCGEERDASARAADALEASARELQAKAALIRARKP